MVPICCNGLKVSHTQNFCSSNSVFAKHETLLNPKWIVMSYYFKKRDNIDTTVLQYNQLSTILSNPTPEDVEDAHFGNLSQQACVMMPSEHCKSNHVEIAY